MSAEDQIAQLAFDLRCAREALKVAAAAKDAAQRAQDKAETALFDALENANLRQIRTADGLFSLSDLAWPQIEDEDAARRWADAEFPEAITLNRQRLQTLVRERLRKDVPLPPGIGFSTTRKINWRSPE